MKTAIGIDVSYQKLNVHFLGSESPNFTLFNDEIYIENFIKDQKLNPEKHVIGCESTGRYHLACQEVFVKKGFEFHLLNPILTGNKIASSIRKKKTDKSDAKLIAQLISQGEGRIVTERDLDITRRTMFRTRRKIVDHRTSFKIIIKDLAKLKSDSKLKKTMRSIEKCIKQMDKCVKSIEAEALEKSGITETEELIDSIPGFATRLSAIVATEVQDFSRFSSARKFKAYVGIDPKVIQSGNSLETGRITKRGNVHLRSAFYMAAQVARQHDPELKEFYQKKIMEGKAVRVAIVAVARKLCERVFSVVKRRTPYEVREPSYA